MGSNPLVVRICVAAGLIAGLSCASAASDVNDHVACIDEEVGAGEAYIFDPAGAIVIGQAIASDHPELQPLVDAVADYQRQYPNTDLFTFEDEVFSGKTSANFVLLIATLAEHPELATPEVLDFLLERTEGFGVRGDVRNGEEDPGGIHGLTLPIFSSSVFDDEFTDEMQTLSDLVRERLHAAEEEKGVTDVVELGCVIDHNREVR